jgi:hypothetical protein
LQETQLHEELGTRIISYTHSLFLTLACWTQPTSILTTTTTTTTILTTTTARTSTYQHIVTTYHLTPSQPQTVIERYKNIDIAANSVKIVETILLLDCIKYQWL